VAHMGERFIRRKPALAMTFLAAYISRDG
jgi:hypothetical protein